MPWDLTVELGNRPGALADIGELLGKEGINIEGIAAAATDDPALVHVLVDDPTDARRVLGDADISIVGDREVLVVDCPDQPGELGRRARQLADANVNIDLVYLASRTRLVFGTDDPAAAAAALA
ncbi:MAG: ACT domain-containing protein [Nitriliruptorales bacterium]